ncbi:MAG: zinc ABC transporter substrate-binding protein [Candidatus Korarchaeum sp.]
MRWVPVTLLLLTTAALPVAARPEGVRVVATFSNLVYDLKLISCPQDEIDYLAPPGLDPHDYELRPGDLEKLRRADLILSLAHAPFEVSVRELISKGEIKAKLIEVPSIEGIRIYSNPLTGQPNYHMPIYDPMNYLVLMRELREALKELNPTCSETYDMNYLEVENRVRSIVMEARRMNLTALASTPIAQYALEWLGIEVRFLLMKEEGISATPSELSEIYRAARNKEIGIVVTVGDESTPVNLKAIEIADEFGIRRVNVPSPLEGSSIPDKLTKLIRALKEEGVGSKPANTIDLTSTLILAVSVMLIAIYFLRKKRS